VKTRAKPRIVVVFNRDFEGAEADPENKAREDIRDIAEQIARILEGAGYETSGLGVTNDVAGAVQTLRSRHPDVVFNLCESIHGDNRFESLLPLLLDLEGIAYTGSGPFALSLALRKDRAKEILRGRGIPVPAGVVVASESAVADVALGFPLIVKPAREDASVGISSASVVHDPLALAERVRHVLRHYRQPALVEQYIDGREIYVSLLGRLGESPQIFPFFEIDFSDMPPDRPKIVSFEGKWVEDSVEYHGTRPVRCEGLTPALRNRIADTALRAFEAMELRDYARMDIRLTPDGTPYIIDVNPNCDLSDLAGGFSKAAKAGGLSYRDVILRLVSLAMARRPDAGTIPFAERTRSRRGKRPAAEVDRAASPGLTAAKDAAAPATAPPGRAGSGSG
jgi:D-alanine-D-alanine ligase